MEPMVLFSDDRLKMATVYEADGRYVVNLKDVVHKFEVNKKYHVLDMAMMKAKEWVGL